MCACWQMLSETLAMDVLDQSTSTMPPGVGGGSSTVARCGGGLMDSPGSCLSSGYCSDDAGSGHDGVFSGRHGKDCWMSTTPDVDAVDLLPPPPTFDDSAAAAVTSCHDPVCAVDKFDDVVDNWLFHSVSVPSPCVEDWPPLPPLSAATSHHGLDDLPTDSVLADLLLNQSAYTAASSTHPAPPEATESTDVSTATTAAAAELGGKPAPADTATLSSSCQPEVGGSTTTKRTLELLDSCESSAARRRRSSPCTACRGRLPEVTSSVTSSKPPPPPHRAVCSECSTAAAAADAERRRSTTSTTCTAPSSSSSSTTAGAEVDLCRLSTLRPDWPGFADLVASEPAVCPLDPPPADADRASVGPESPSTSNPDADKPAETSAAAVYVSESSRTLASRPVILEALLRSSSRLDANKGSSAALVWVCGCLPTGSRAFYGGC